jgi:hypothetical protein
VKLIYITGILTLVSVLSFATVFARREVISARFGSAALSAVGHTFAALWGGCLVLVGALFYRNAWPLSAFFTPLLTIIGIQISLWSLGINLDFGNMTPLPTPEFSNTLQTTALLNPNPMREQKTGRGFLRKWYHPIYFVTALFLGALIGHKIKIWTDFGPQDPARPYVLHSEPWMLITAITIMVLVMVKDRYFETTAIRTLEDVTAASDASWTRLTKWIVDNLTPTIISLPDRDKVLEQASSIINTAISEKNEGESYVVFTGSAALYRDLEDQESDADTPLAQYRTAMARLASDTVHCVRYISLLEVSDYRRRGSITKEDYVKWIEKQIGLVERNPHYFLYNCPRAPSWGSSRSSIFTARAMLDVVGNGESGILIRGDQVSQDIARSSKELFEERALVKPVVYDKPMLMKYLKTLTASTTSDDDVQE